MQALAQFVVLFSGPIGLALLFAVVVVLWIVRSHRERRRERKAPHLAVIDGAERETPGETPATRPELHVVGRGAAGRRTP